MEINVNFKIIIYNHVIFSFLLNSMVFNVFPTAFEIALVSGILASKCGPEFAMLTGGTIATYTAFTIACTQWRTKFRRQMNALEN